MEKEEPMETQVFLNSVQPCGGRRAWTGDRTFSHPTHYQCRTPPPPLIKTPLHPYVREIYLGIHL